MFDYDEQDYEVDVDFDELESFEIRHEKKSIPKI